MQEFKTAFFDQLNRTHSKHTFTKGMLLCAYEIKNLGLGINLNKLRVKNIVEIGMQHKLPTALLYGGMFNLMGAFGFTVDYAKSHAMFKELTDCPSSEDYSDLANLMLSFIYLTGLGAKQCQHTAKHHIDQIKDKTQILFEFMARAVYAEKLEEIV